MKKIFKTPLLQCCRTLPFKQTQTDLSLMNRKKIDNSNSIEQLETDISSYSLDFDTTNDNHNSYNFIRKSGDSNLENCGRCTKCLLVNLDENPYILTKRPCFLQKRSDKIESKGDTPVVVEVPYSKSNSQAINKTKQSINSKRSSFQTLHRAREQKIHSLYYSGTEFDFEEYIVARRVDKTDPVIVLCLTQSLYKNEVMKSLPITIHRMLSYTSFEYIDTEFDESIDEYSDYGFFKETSCTIKDYPILQSSKWQTPYENSTIIKVRKKHKCPAVKTCYMRLPKEDVDKDKHFQKLIFSRLKCNGANLFPIREYKDFLRKWKMRKMKTNCVQADKKDTTISKCVPCLNEVTDKRTPSKAYMIRFINKQFKNDHITSSTVNNSSKNSCRNPRNKATHSSNYIVRDKSPKFVNLTFNKMETYLIDVMYDITVALIADQLRIVIDIFDKKVSKIKSSRPSVIDNNNNVISKSLVKKKDRIIEDSNRSHYSTSNTQEFTASTAFDISSDEVYSEENSSLLSL